MKENMLKTSISDFVEERLLECYIKVSKTKEYKKKKTKYIKQEENFNKKLKNELLKEYENIKNQKLYLDTLELEEAYRTGFRDSIKIIQG